MVFVFIRHEVLVLLSVRTLNKTTKTRLCEEAVSGVGCVKVIYFEKNNLEAWVV